MAKGTLAERIKVVLLYTELNKECGNLKTFGVLVCDEVTDGMLGALKALSDAEVVPMSKTTLAKA